MQMALGAARKTPALRIFLVVLALVAASLAVAGTAQASPPGGIASTTPEAEVPTETGPPGKTMLVNGRAIPPINAPPAVKRVIAAANQIRTKPYIWGGGHGRWWDRGYDCSGAVSFALHGGGFLSSPLPSGPMESWGQRRQRPLDHRLRQRRPRLCGNRRPPLGHRRQHPRHRPEMAQISKRSSERVLRSKAPRRLLTTEAARRTRRAGG
jgi:hypothetical protein